MSVYIETVIFNNFFLDLLLLLATATLRRRKLKKWRVLLATLIGCISATFYVIVPEWAQYTMRALLAPVMCIVAMSPQGKSRFNKLGDFIGTVFIFAMLTFFTGGVIFGVSYALGVDIKSYATLGFIAMGAAALIICARLIARKKSSDTNGICQTTINVGGYSVRACALCDSGNLLVDDVSGLPVVILSLDLENKLNLTCESNKSGAIKGFIQVSTVSGDDSLALVGLDEVDVNGKQYKALGALSHRNFDSFDVILQNSMFQYGVDVNGKHYKALGALSHRNFDSIDVILQNSIFQYGVDVNGKQYKALGALSHRNFDSIDVILQNSIFQCGKLP